MSRCRVDIHVQSEPFHCRHADVTLEVCVLHWACPREIAGNIPRLLFRREDLVHLIPIMCPRSLILLRRTFLKQRVILLFHHVPEILLPCVEKRHCPRDPGIVLSRQVRTNNTVNHKTSGRIAYDLYSICDFAHSLDTIPGVASLYRTWRHRHTDTQRHGDTETHRHRDTETQTQKHTERLRHIYRRTTENHGDKDPTQSPWTGHLLTPHPPTQPHSPTHSAAHPQTDTFQPPPQPTHARPSIIKSHMNNTGHIS